jgi:transcriptional regulator with XRE-family HTH domain
MRITNVYKGSQRTPAQKANEEEVRRLFEDWRPGPQELLASGKWKGPIIVEGQQDFWKALGQVRAFRQAQGLTLKDVSDRCGIDVATLSKLENGKQANPTLFTILLYVGAVGRRLHISVRPGLEEPLQVSVVRQANLTRDGAVKPTRKRTNARKARPAKARE